jgi:copper chaperone CopZ
MKKYKIKGMNCASCASLIQMDLEDAGYKCKCSYNSEVLEIEGEHDIKKITEIVIKTGYTLETN